MTPQPAPNLLHVHDFLGDRQALSREEFLKKYPHPVLVIPLTPEGRGLEDDGAFHTRQVTSELYRKSLPPASKQTAVVPIAKHAADAFQAFIWVGRETRCDVILPFTSVSKLQAQFVKKPDGELELLDAGSTNGTFVEGTRLEKNKSVHLGDRMQLTFGKIPATFRTPEGFWDEVGLFL